jgi:hypothetical protein
VSVYVYVCVCVCVCVRVCIYTHTDLWALMDGGAMPVGVVSRTSVFNVGFGGMLESWMQEMRGTNTKEKIYKRKNLQSQCPSLFTI